MQNDGEAEDRNLETDGWCQRMQLMFCALSFLVRHTTKMKNHGGSKNEENVGLQRFDFSNESSCCWVLAKN